MFLKCESLISLSLDNFDTSKVEDMNHMFAFCSNLTSLTLGIGFDTTGLYNGDQPYINYMFRESDNLEALHLYISAERIIDELPIDTWKVYKSISYNNAYTSIFMNTTIGSIRWYPNNKNTTLEEWKKDGRQWTIKRTIEST